jgi:hypothetical protein
MQVVEVRRVEVDLVKVAAMHRVHLVVAAAASSLRPERVVEVDLVKVVAMHRVHLVVAAVDNSLLPERVNVADSSLQVVGVAEDSSHHPPVMCHWYLPKIGPIGSLLAAAR